MQEPTFVYWTLMPSRRHQGRTVSNVALKRKTDLHVELHHEFVVPVDIAAAWSAFTDLERIAPCLPGAVITSVDGDTFTGTANVKLGPIALQYRGEGTWVDQDPSTYSAVIRAQGKDKRGNGTANAVISARMGTVTTGTRVEVETQLKISGRPAQFGRGVIQDVGSKLLDQFAACLAVSLAEPQPASPPAPGTAACDQAVDGSGEGLARTSPAIQQPPSVAGDGVNLWKVAGPVLVRRWGPWLVGAVALVGLVWLAIAS